MFSFFLKQRVENKSYFWFMAVYSVTIPFPDLHKLSGFRDRKEKNLHTSNSNPFKIFYICAHKDLQSEKKKTTPIFFLAFLYFYTDLAGSKCFWQVLGWKYFVNVCIIFSSEESELFQGTRADSTDHKINEKSLYCAKIQKRPKTRTVPTPPHNSAFFLRLYQF